MRPTSRSGPACSVFSAAGIWRRSGSTPAAASGCSASGAPCSACLSGDASVYLALALLALAALALRAGFRRVRTPASTLADINRLLLVFLFLLSPDYPWYFLCAVPFLALLGGAPGWVLTVGGFMLYDVVTGDPQVPFYLRDAAFNGLFLAAAAFAWLRRFGAPVEART